MKEQIRQLLRSLYGVVFTENATSIEMGKKKSPFDRMISLRIARVIAT
ncbi:MAG: hypothetical protein WBP41_08975 [Saprospiraceae bacterium]